MCFWFTQKSQGFQASKLPQFFFPKKKKHPSKKLLRMVPFKPVTKTLNLAIKTPTKMNNSQRQHQQKWIFTSFFNQILKDNYNKQHGRHHLRPVPKPQGTSGHFLSVLFPCKLKASGNRHRGHLLLGCPVGFVRINGDRINGLVHLLIHGVYWGCPLMNGMNVSCKCDPSPLGIFREKNWKTFFCFLFISPPKKAGLKDFPRKTNPREFPC